MFPKTTEQYYTRVTATIKEGEQLVQQGFLNWVDRTRVVAYGARGKHLRT